MKNSSARIVSSEGESLILVDAADKETGFLSKAECHDGQGVLHRAFSVFLFNGDGELLLQQRAPAKRLWPMYWSNSCCSHPRRRELVEEAAVRRLQDELHTGSELEFVYKFIYQAPFEDLGAEHELCHVFLGHVIGEPAPNDNEISSTRYVSAGELEREFEQTPEVFTPWFKMEWRHLNQDFPRRLSKYLGSA